MKETVNKQLRLNDKYFFANKQYEYSQEKSNSDVKKMLRHPSA